MLAIGSITAQAPWALQGMAATGAGTSAGAAAVGAVAAPGVAAAHTASDLESFLTTLNQVLQQSGGIAAKAALGAGGAASPSAAGLASGLEASFQRLMQDLALNGTGGLSAAQVNAASANSERLQGSLQAQLANLRNIDKAATGRPMVHASA